MSLIVKTVLNGINCIFPWTWSSWLMRSSSSLPQRNLQYLSCLHCYCWTSEISRSLWAVTVSLIYPLVCGFPQPRLCHTGHTEMESLLLWWGLAWVGACLGGGLAGWGLTLVGACLGGVCLGGACLGGVAGKVCCSWWYKPTSCKGSWGHLNIKMMSYQYRIPILNIKWSHCITWLSWGLNHSTAVYHVSHGVSARIMTTTLLYSMVVMESNPQHCCIAWLPWILSHNTAV